MSAANDNDKKARPCPICGEPMVVKYRPFCSKHCADVDLGRWLKGTYAIPAVEPPDEFEAEAAFREAAQRPSGGEED
jgi:hypothetical protein